MSARIVDLVCDISQHWGGSERADTLSDDHPKEGQMESYTCDACGGSFKSKAELDAHVQREHAQQPSEKTPPDQEKKER